MIAVPYLLRIILKGIQLRIHQCNSVYNLFSVVEVAELYLDHFHKTFMYSAFNTHVIVFIFEFDIMLRL